jgi:DNA invertase Pin-like site-specific DNA recombinase
MKFGYARSSLVEDSSLDAQCERLLAAGCEKFFCDIRSGSSRNLPARTQLLEEMKAGDIFVVTRIDRISRLLEEGCIFIRALKLKGCFFQPLQQPECGFLNQEQILSSRLSIGINLLLAEAEYTSIVQRIINNPKSFKAKKFPLEEIAEAYSKKANLQQILAEKRFKHFRSSATPIAYALEEKGVKQPKIHRAAALVAEKFNRMVSEHPKRIEA